MPLDKRIIVAALLSMITLGAEGCKNPQSSNQQNSNQISSRQPARWLPQWRSAYTKDLTGVNLAVYAYSSLCVVSRDVVFVAGEMPNPKNPKRRIGVVVHTTNGGQNWTETLMDQYEGKDTSLNSIHFVNPKVGWIAGALSTSDEKAEGILWRTTDGGATWALTKLPFKQIPTCVFFADEMTGWMGGAAGAADQEDTPTAAKSHNKQTAPAAGQSAKGSPGGGAGTGSEPAIVPNGDDPEEGGPSDILTTTDGGQTWRSQRRLSTSINTIFFVDKQTGWAGGYKGAIFHTSDGGRVWSQQRSELEFNEQYTDPKSEDAQNFIISGIHFLDARSGLAAAGAADEDLGRILGTTDGGASWSRKLIAQGEGIRDVLLLSPTEGWAVPRFPKYIYHTIDGGRYWEGENVVFEQEVPFFRLGAADSEHIWAVGSGAIFHRVP